MRRRLSQSAPTPAAPQVAAVQTAAPPAAQTAVIEPEVLPPAAAPAPANGAGTALALAPAIAQMFAWTPPAQAIVPPSSGLVAPVIRFFNGSEGKQGGELTALQIAQGIPGIAAGHPYIYTPEGGLYSMHGAIVLQTLALQFWAAYDQTGSRLATWLRQQGRNATHLGERVQECVLAAHVVLPTTAPLHPDLAPGVICLSTWKGATSGAAARMELAIEEAQSVQWCKANPVAGGLPPRMRVFGRLQTEVATSKKRKGADGRETGGFQYVKAGMLVVPASQISEMTINAFREWNANADCVSEAETVIEEFNSEAASIRAAALDAAS